MKIKGYIEVENSMPLKSIFLNKKFNIKMNNTKGYFVTLTLALKRHNT
jgi:hypothetical protein